MECKLLLVFKNIKMFQPHPKMDEVWTRTSACPHHSQNRLFKTLLVSKMNRLDEDALRKSLSILGVLLAYFWILTFNKL
jgi:hypothetical protein